MTMRPLIAILRGVEPEQVLPIAEEIIRTGIRQIEVPLNSPRALDSIGLLADRYADQAMIGAGTVLSSDMVEQVYAVGGRLIVAPNCDPLVIQSAKQQGMTVYPGVVTATESFAALQAGADGLKLFPAFQLGITGLQALKAVLPAGTPTYAVGGADHNNFSAWLAAGVTGFGIGSALYKAGDAAIDIGLRAQAMVDAYDRALGS